MIIDGWHTTIFSFLTCAEPTRRSDSGDTAGASGRNYVAEDDTPAVVAAEMGRCLQSVDWYIGVAGLST